MRPELEARDDPEVPTASPAARPEKIRVLVLAALEELSGGGDEREAGHVVARQAELAPCVADTASLRVAGDPDRRAGAGGDRVAVCRERRVDVDQAGARADRGNAVTQVDAVHPRDVDDYSRAGGRVTRVGVATTTGDEVDRVFPCPPDGLLDVGGRLAVHDRPRVRAIEAAVDQHLVTAVGGACRRYDSPLDVPRELAQRAGRRFQPEAGEDAEGARSQRDTRCPLDEFASVDGSTLRRELRGA